MTDMVNMINSKGAELRLQLFYSETNIPKLFQAISTHKKCLQPNKYGRKQLLNI